MWEFKIKCGDDDVGIWVDNFLLILLFRDL